ncbi:MAG: hypothetical protein Q9163_002412 [Psora crenata]
MSLFPHFPNNEFAPLFRLLDDYSSQGGSSAIRAFQPKFDVREHKDSYELQGELPGIEQKDIHIEFADPHTLVIKGHVEREYSSEGAQQPRGRITGDVTDSSKSHKATVEDEGQEGSKNTEVAKSGGEGHKDRPKYWVSERCTGEYHRAFAFPSTVDQDGVKATLKNGILSVVVPKKTQQRGKRINIQ